MTLSVAGTWNDEVDLVTSYIARSRPSPTLEVGGGWRGVGAVGGGTGGRGGLGGVEGGRGGKGGLGRGRGG